MKNKGGRPKDLLEKIDTCRLLLKEGYKIKEIAKLLGKAERTVKWWIQEGKLSTD